jgi:hypothetical protein
MERGMSEYRTFCECQDSSFSTVVLYGVDVRSSNADRCNCLLPIESILVLGPKRFRIESIQGLEMQEREADHSHPYTAEVKTAVSIPLYFHVFMAKC